MNKYLEDRIMEITQSEGQTESQIKRKKKWKQCKGLGDNTGFPGSASGRKQCRRHKNHGFDPWLRGSPGGGHGNPLQDSCLEAPMEGGAWWATVHSVAKSGTCLSDWAHVYTWDNIMCSSLSMIETPEGGERQNGTKSFFEEIMAENFPKRKKETNARYRKQRESQTRRTETDLHQDIL